MTDKRRHRGAASVRLLFLIPVLLLSVVPVGGYLFIESATSALMTVATAQQRHGLKSLKEFIERNPDVPGDTGLTTETALFVHDSGSGSGSGSAVDIDGQANEWQDVPAVHFGQDQLIQLNTTFSPDSLDATVKLQRDKNKTYMLLTVKDDVVVYREISHISIHRNDHVRLAMLDPSGSFQRYTLATEQPGQIFARIVTTGGRALRPEPKIAGFWRATGEGYQLELAIDNDLLSNRFSFNVADVDDFITRDIKFLLGNQYTDSPAELGHLIQRSAALEAAFERFNIRDAMFQDSMGNILAGTALPPNNAQTMQEIVYFKDQAMGTLTQIVAHPEVDAYRREALQQLSVVSTVSFTLGLLLAYWLSSRLLRRLKQMGQELEAVVDDQGRVLKPMLEVSGTDELSELTQRFATITRRLQQYNDYLENLSRRLAHELRTPVSVVRSSLEHLESRVSGDDRRYVERARHGVARLTNILNSMSEAARLEQSLDKDEVVIFEMTNVVKGCFEGYDNAFPDQPFELSIEATELKITGIPDLFAQMLDKLVDNAVQFSASGQAVILRLTEEDDMAVLRITNAGPGLPSTMAEQLFDPMISVRDDEQRQDSHLGLGLHVARIITEFHGGTVTLSNREDREGVVAAVRLPLMRLTSKLV